METFSDELKERLLAKLEEFAERHRELEAQLADPGIVSDNARLAEVAREHGGLGKFMALRAELQAARQEQAEAREAIAESDDEPEFRQMAQEELDRAAEREQKCLEQFVNELVDDEAEGSRDVLVEIRPGTGGEEAALFAMDLFRMYSRYAEKHGWTIDPIDSTTTELGGLREMVFAVKGRGAWRKLRYESGGHRVQRVPETESQGRIHTSMATVAVIPEAEEVDVDIPQNEIEMSFFRSSGPGGQHVNKTSSCVRLVHKPTGIAVRCQDQKSQNANRRKAMDLLRAKLYQMRQEEQHQQRDELRKSKIGSGDRNARIRTYNFPQDRITDHRIGLDVFGIETFLMGDCDRMFDALAEHDRAERIAAFTEAGVLPSPSER